MPPWLKLDWRVSAGLALAAAAVIWWGLDALEPRVNWLWVEAPRRAVAGQPLTLRVHLAPLAEPARVCADLHWGTTRNGTLGCLASGGSQPVGREGGTFDFALRVPPMKELQFVSGVIYLSRTGQWRDQTRMAFTEFIPVRDGAGARVETQLKPLRVQPPDDRAGRSPRAAAVPRWLTALLFLAGAVMARRAVAAPAAPVAGADTRFWQILAVLLLLAGLGELFAVEDWLGARAREIARAHDLYYLRSAFQKISVSLAGAATLVWLILGGRACRPRRLLLLAGGLYLGISAANLVSLHAVDRFADLSWRGIALVQALKLACALLILFGIHTARRAEN